MARINRQSALAKAAQLQAQAGQKQASAARYRATSPVVSTPAVGLRTYEGAQGYARDAKSELYLLAVANFAGEDTFYEKSDERGARFKALVRQLAIEDPEWTVRLLRYLRTEANIRTASIIGAVEFVKARLDAKAPSVPAYEIPGFTSDRGLERAIIGAVQQRADEPGEVLAYWTSQYGRPIPKPITRGVADGVNRLYNEWSMLKYDTDAHSFRFGDVIQLVGPKVNEVIAAGLISTGDDDQRAGRVANWVQRNRVLYQYAKDRRKGTAEGIPAELRVLRANQDLRAQLARDPDSTLTPELLRDAGMTWQNVLSLVGNKVDKAKLWEALIPTMGYMALLRNLRNFDEAGVSDKVANGVIAKLADPEEVARSRQFPFRFLSAHKATRQTSLRWGHALNQALVLSLQNVPALAGRTLILVDLSGSMGMAAGGNLSDMTRAEVATLFGSAVALRATDATLVWFDNNSGPIQIPKGAALLNVIHSFPRAGGGTATGAAMRRWFNGHNRVVIVTDEQSHSDAYGYKVDSTVPASVPIYTWNLAGYKAGHLPSGSGNRHTFGGLTDDSFKLIPILESANNGDWPF